MMDKEIMDIITARLDTQTQNIGMLLEFTDMLKNRIEALEKKVVANAAH